MRTTFWLNLFIMMLWSLFLFTDVSAASNSDDKVTSPSVGLYQAKQRVVFTDGCSSFLMIGDPEQNAVRYPRGQVLPELLKEGWKIVSVTPAANASIQGGKSFMVLEIPILPYDNTLNVWEGDEEVFPGTGVMVALSHNNPPGPLLPMKVVISFDSEKVELCVGDLRKPRFLKNGYYIQSVDWAIEDEMIAIKFRLCTDMSKMGASNIAANIDGRIFGQPVNPRPRH
jgi:hypothetical protein